jgi:hypothetical protein
MIINVDLSDGLLHDYGHGRRLHRRALPIVRCHRHLGRPDEGLLDTVTTGPRAVLSTAFDVTGLATEAGDTALQLTGSKLSSNVLF